MTAINLGVFSSEFQSSGSFPKLLEAIQKSPLLLEAISKLPKDSIKVNGVGEGTKTNSGAIGIESTLIQNESICSPCDNTGNSRFVPQSLSAKQPKKYS